MRVNLSVPAVLLLLSAAVSPAIAQDAAECTVDTYQPTQLAQAGIAIGSAASAATSDAAKKTLRDAMKFLKDEDETTRVNPVGTGFLKAQIYILWLHQDSVPDVMTNEALNAAGPKTGTVDLLVASDSLLKAVEAQGPACAELTAQWRQSKPWTDRLNKAYQFLGADMIDSAEYYVNRAVLLSDKSPFVHNALAQIADKRGDKEGLLRHLKMAIDLAAADTSMAQTRRQMRFQYAMNLQAQAMAGDASSRDARLDEAAKVFTALLNGAPSSAEAAYAFSSASEIISMRQDTTAGRELLSTMAAQPANYNDLTLLLAADMARLLNRNEDATKFYAAALAQNPNIRDANYFLAFMYYEQKDGAKMLPLTTKLIEIDPSNPENYVLHSEALKLAAEAEADPAKKKALLAQSVEAGKQEASMPHKLLVTQFERRDEGALLRGAVENRSKAAKSYTVTFDFLDASGAVVQSVTTEVPSVAPNAMGEFTVEATTPGIVAYKYAPIK